MDQGGKVLRMGAASVICAVALRLFSGGLPGKVLAFFSQPEVAAFILYLETGRVVRPAAQEAESPPPETLGAAATTAPTEPAVETAPDPLPAVFTPEDAALVEINSACGYGADIPAMLLQPLEWDLTMEAPTVLILHTHGSECYGSPVFSADYRTLDNQYNVVSIGAELARQLEARGIRVIQDTTLHDQPSYNDAYANAREVTRAYLEQYPSIKLVLDIHRDAAEDSRGQQISKSITVDGESVAQLMLVVGTDAGGLTHPLWAENMALAVKLHAKLETICPGICRPISFRSQRFNQDLSTGALIIEVGAAGNSQAEALAAAAYLAEALEGLAFGSVSAEAA